MYNDVWGCAEILPTLDCVAFRFKTLLYMYTGFYVRYIYSQSASYQPALFIRLRELAGKPDKVLGVNLN